ncbi:FUSC family protein [Fodinicurvata halophila]|uniref:FUSC family protein n=1 Tax=Fodinicurvata halophila TaxID=1419723 RepID=A0ABV8UMG1_9PROT
MVKGLAPRLRIRAAWRALRSRSIALKLAVRLIVAGVLGLLVARLLNVPQDYWIVIAALLVVQGSVGATLVTGRDRMIGTLFGALAGGLAALLLQPESVEERSLAVILTLAPLAVLAAFRPPMRIAPVTAAIVLLADPSHTHIVESAAFRVLEIFLGTLIGFAVSLFVLPSRAHKQLTLKAAQGLRLMEDLLHRYEDSFGQQPQHSLLDPLHERLRSTLAEVEATVDEVRRERANRMAEAPDPEPLARNLRRLRSDVVFMGRTLVQPMPSPILTRLEPVFEEVAETIRSHLRQAARAYEIAGPPPSLDDVEAALEHFTQTLEQIRHEHLTQPLPTTDLGQIYALPFTLENFRENLRDLDARIAERQSELRTEPDRKPPAEPTGN